MKFTELKFDQILEGIAMKQTNLCLLICLCMHINPSFAQFAPSEHKKEAPNVALEAEYKGCEGGYYNGPRPGRVRYTKDPWIWAVTPAFAKKYCFPAEFISTELKGAEAVAVKMHENPDEIVCGWGDNKEVCRPTERMWRFELYVPTGTIPKSRDAPYFNSARLASRMLLTKSREFQKSVKNNDTNPKPGALGVLTTDQVDLYGIKNEKAVWGLGRMGLDQYYERVMPTLDFIALTLRPGELGNDKQYQRGMDKFVIGFRKPTVTYAFTDKDYAEAPLKVELPKSLMQKLRQQDAQELGNLIKDVQRSLSGPVVKP
jgi:hypothetical protein